MKTIVKFFSKSGLGVDLLIQERNIAGKDKPAMKLISIGRTQFGSHWSTAASLYPCLQAIRSLVWKQSIKFKVQGMSKSLSGKLGDFEVSIIQALWSLEAAHANASDVFVFFVAIAAVLKELFDQDHESDELEKTFPPELAEQIIFIYNRCYENSLVGMTFTLSRFASILTGPTTGKQLKHMIPHADAYERFKSYLKSKLKVLLQDFEVHPKKHPIILQLGSAKVIDGLRTQTKAFWLGHYPFDTAIRKDQHVLDWWRELERHPHAQVLAMLAIRIFSMTVNSMADERTNSHITWFNSALRSNQKADVLIDMVLVGQWYGKHQNDKAKSPRHPVVRFCDISETVIEKLEEKCREQAMSQEKPVNTGEPGGEGDEDNIFGTDESDEIPDKDTAAEESARELDFKVDQHINWRSPFFRALIQDNGSSTVDEEAVTVPPVDICSLELDDTTLWDW
ncbi:hypothetical protein C8R42DRAFT_643053 [Lentinula raphanica]|nr:hypothetical protein C8R42DRAFT_643053 [Lentinula raphanica]